MSRHRHSSLCLAVLVVVTAAASCRRPPTTTSDVDGGVPLPVKCTNWTRVASSPMPDSFRVVHGFGPQNVYTLREKSPSGTAAVDGELMHYDGVTTTSMTTLSGRPQDIWGSGPSDIYVLHGSLQTFSFTPPNSPHITHFDGFTWSRLTKAPSIGGYRAIWGSGPNDVYVVGGYRYSSKGNGAVLHFDGASWSVAYKVDPRFAFDAIWGSGPGDVFVSGCCDANDDGGIYHFDGTSWSKSLSQKWATFEAIWGSGPTDVFAVGNGGIYHYDGAGWTKQALPWHKATIGPLTAVWGSSSNRVFAGGILTLLRWDGQAWSLVDKPPGSFSYETHYIYDMWGSGSTLFVAGAEWGGPGALWRATCTP